ncbi:MAG: hypothetical protein Q8T11_17630 [Elusimicrobiota bacterium]|nr:hypothetical protein [Elusimicrobiota bacterium]
MDGATAGAWAVGMMVGIAAAVVGKKKLTKSPDDPEARLKELIGESGISQRDHNRAEAEKKANAEILEGALKAAQKLRAEGDVAGAEKLEAYAETIRARG